MDQSPGRWCADAPNVPVADAPIGRTRRSGRSLARPRTGRRGRAPRARSRRTSSEADGDRRRVDRSVGQGDDDPRPGDARRADRARRGSRAAGRVVTSHGRSVEPGRRTTSPTAAISAGPADAPSRTIRRAARPPTSSPKSHATPMIAELRRGAERHAKGQRRVDLDRPGQLHVRDRDDPDDAERRSRRRAAARRRAEPRATVPISTRSRRPRLDAADRPRSRRAVRCAGATPTPSSTAAAAPPG